MHKLLFIASTLALAGGCTFGSSSPIGGWLTMTTSNLSGANITVDTFESVQHAGFWNISEASDEGWSIVTAMTSSTAAILSQDCKGVAIGFAGRPAIGRVITLDLPSEHMSGDTEPDAIDVTDRGSFAWQEGCITNGEFAQWRSTTGTLEITDVREIDPKYVQAGTDPSAVKTIAFAFSGMSLAPDGTQAADAVGTFDAEGEGELDLFSGMHALE